jgi:hypothetical protein
MMNTNIGSLGEAAPGAAPTPRQRGPWRPRWTSRQGRLPTWKASPRRERPWYCLHCKFFLDTVMRSHAKSLQAALARLVVAKRGAPIAVSRAMVVGMAMALMATSSHVAGPAVSSQGHANSSQLAATANPNPEGPVYIGELASSFTPLHTTGLEVWTSAFGTNVWGGSPPRQVGGSWSPLSEAALEALTAARGTGRTRRTWRSARTRRGTLLTLCLRYHGYVGTDIKQIILENLESIGSLDMVDYGITRVITKVKPEFKVKNGIRPR